MDAHNDLVNGITWSRGENRRILLFKRAPKQEKLVFTNFYLLYSMDFGYVLLRIFFAKIFHERQILTELMVQFIPRGQHAHFQFKTSPKQDYQIFPNLGCYCQCIFMTEFQNKLPNFFTDIRYNLINRFSWSREENKRIFKFKQAPKQKK